jgi:hypothetical protein
MHLVALDVVEIPRPIALEILLAFPTATSNAWLSSPATPGSTATADLVVRGVVFIGMMAAHDGAGIVARAANTTSRAMSSNEQNKSMTSQSCSKDVQGTGCLSGIQASELSFLQHAHVY